MLNLTPRELQVFNFLSKLRDPDVKLGDKMAEIINASCETGTPVNAISAKATLAITGVSIHGETFTIGDDTYEFLTDSLQSKAAPENIAINITTTTVQASGSLTVDTQPISGDTFTIGTKTYVFVPVGTANFEGEISIGADLAEVQIAIIAAINGTDGHNTPNTLVSASDFSNDISTITSFIGGTIGNSIATTETFTAVGNIFGGTTLSSGTNCTAANTALAVIAAINNNTKSLVSAAAGTGDAVVITAKTSGADGNKIGLAKIMANADFEDDTESIELLTGGINGTIASGMKFMADSTYMYFCPMGNKISDKNWRRVSLGSVY